MYDEDKHHGNKLRYPLKQYKHMMFVSITHTSASFYVAVNITRVVSCCKHTWVALLWLNAKHLKSSAHPPLWQTCKVLPPMGALSQDYTKSVSVVR